MKATGIIRRIDDLGRVVIPKEIRHKFGFKENDELDVFTTEEGVLFCKHNRMFDKEKAAQDWLREGRAVMVGFETRFTIDGNVTTCECILRGKRKVGTAKCDPRDAFSPSVGMVYAFCRATDTALPWFLQ